MKATASILGAGIPFLIFLASAQDSPPLQNPAQDPTPATTPHYPDEISRLLQEWTPPTDEPHANGSGDARRFLGNYLSTKPLAEVWTHYATKLGMTPPPKNEGAYQANFHTEQFPKLGPRVSDGRASLTIKNVQFADQPERSATLVRREPNGKMTTVFLASQGERTSVFVMVVPEK